MLDLYRLPAIVLLTIIAGVFAALYQRYRTAQTLLWMVAWSLIVIRLICAAAPGSGQGSLTEVVGRCSLMAAAAMFTGSLSPLKFRSTGILYVVLFAIPMLLYCALTALFPASPWPVRSVELLLVGIAVVVVVLWGAEKNIIPRWYSLPVPAIIGLLCLYQASLGNTQRVIRTVQVVLYLNTALLFWRSSRRWSPGKILTIAAFLLWAALIAFTLLYWQHPSETPMIRRLINLDRMVAALGMLILVLEEEIRKNALAKQREHQVRTELERFAALHVWVMPGHETGRLCQQISEAIASTTRFSQTVIFLRGLKLNFQLAASSGMDGALTSALAALGERLTPGDLDASWQSQPSLCTGGICRQMDLTRWFVPGDELEHLHFNSLYALPMRSQTGRLDGFIGLAGIRDPDRELLPDDLLPSETLAARLAIAIEHSALGQRLVRSEKLAGIGQLAGGVAHELNNPLTAVMGYSELIEELAGDDNIRRSASIIRSESHRMKKIIDALVRFGKPVPHQHQPNDIRLLLAEIEELSRPQLQRKGIDLEVAIAGDIPPVAANGDQLRQVFRQILNNAEDTLEQNPTGLERRIRVDASCHDHKLHILFTDTGAGFAAPSRVFDPFFTTKEPGAGLGLGLSLCYSIVREHRGEISAFNLHPSGGAVLIELPVQDAILPEHPDPVPAISSLS